METKNITVKILSLIERFYSPENNQSIYTLLQDTGYFELHHNITVNIIEEALEQQPQHVVQWIEWSANKRTGSGWYFVQDDSSHKFVVGFLDPEKGITKKTEYTDSKKACASFIKLEIESIRKG